MEIVEAALLTVLFFLCVNATVTDLKEGLILNRSLIYAGVLSLILNVVYYGFFAREYFFTFIINLIVMLIFSVLFYTYHFWGAGDSKLLVAVISLIPARLSYDNQNSVALTLHIVVLAFSVAYVYLVIESVFLTIKQKEIFSFKVIRLNIRQLLRQYVTCFTYLVLINELWSMGFLAKFQTNNPVLILFVNFLIIFTISHTKLFTHIGIVISIGLAALIIGLLTSNHVFARIHLNSYILVFVILFIRIFAEKHNYKTIPTASVMRGMVLSWSTVLLFQKSKVKGIPLSTTEDMRSRLSDLEAASVRKWETSKYGESEVTIVRKMPFGIFISIGTFIFVILRFWLYAN